MLWVLLFAAIGLGGLLTMAALGLWLWHRVRDLLAELGVLAGRAGELAELAAGIRLPEFDGHLADRDVG